MLYFEGLNLERYGIDVKLIHGKRLSKTMYSAHLEKREIDLNLFINGEYKADKESHRPLGEYWKSLHPDNVWGGDFTFNDANHYEMKYNG